MGTDDKSSSLDLLTKEETLFPEGVIIEDDRREQRRRAYQEVDESIEVQLDAEDVIPDALEDRSSKKTRFKKNVPGSQKEKKSWIPFPIKIMIVIVLSLGVGFFFGRFCLLTGGTTGFNNSAIMQKISLIEKLVDKYYYEDIDTKALEDGAYRGFLSGIGDVYSTYYTAEEYTQMQDADAGEYQGIGVTVHKDTQSEYVCVDEVFKGYPAYDAGVEMGDYIIEVNDKDVLNMSLTEVVSEIKGSDSDKVKLKILRGDGTKTLTMTRSKVTVESVQYEMKDNQIGYISISSFLQNTGSQFVDAVDDLEDQEMKGLVIDLRDDGGGLLTSCIEAVSRIIPKGDLIVYTEDKNGKKDKYNSDSSATVDVPIVILVNGNTASASEIMTGCLKDYKLATIIGTKTYGKGIVQNVIPLSDGSAVKLTVSKYFTPDGNYIHKKGIKPDEKVKMTKAEKKAAKEDETKDKQLQKAYDVLSEKIQ